MSERKTKQKWKQDAKLLGLSTDGTLEELSQRVEEYRQKKLKSAGTVTRHSSQGSGDDDDDNDEINDDEDETEIITSRRVSVTPTSTSSTSAVASGGGTRKARAQTIVETGTPTYKGRGTPAHRGRESPAYRGRASSPGPRAASTSPYQGSRSRASSPFARGLLERATRRVNAAASGTAAPVGKQRSQTSPAPSKKAGGQGRKGTRRAAAEAEAREAEEQEQEEETGEQQEGEGEEEGTESIWGGRRSNASPEDSTDAVEQELRNIGVTDAQTQYMRTLRFIKLLYTKVIALEKRLDSRK